MITTRTFILDWFVWVLQKPSSPNMDVSPSELSSETIPQSLCMSLDFYAIRLNECLAVSLSLRSFPDLRLTAWELPASNEILALTAVSGVGWKVLFPLLFSLLLEHHCKSFLPLPLKRNRSISFSSFSFHLFSLFSLSFASHNILFFSLILLRIAAIWVKKRFQSICNHKYWSKNVSGSLMCGVNMQINVPSGHICGIE